MIEQRTRILVVDDLQLVQLGLCALLKTDSRFFLVDAVGTVAEALEAAQKWQPDVVVLDVRLPDGSGVEACRDIRSAVPHTRVIMHTAHADDDTLAASILAGASGYVLKQSDPAHLIDAIEAAARGESLLDPAVTHKVLAWIQRLGAGPDADPLAGLTEQERRILPLVATGKTNREIAAQLFLSDQTVKGYVSSILKKLHVARRAEAAAFIARERPELVELASWPS